jgi:hypothetical protein
MSITFKIGTTLYLTNDTHKYKFLVGDVTASQTFVESRQPIQTLHSRNLIERTFTTEKSSVSLNFSIFLGRGSPEKELAEWFGMPYDTGTKHDILPVIPLSAIPNMADVYLVSGSSTYRISKAVAENLSLTIAHNSILAASITATGADLEDITNDSGSMTTFNGLTEVSQTASGFRVHDVIVPTFSNILGVTLELTRNISWMSQKSTEDIGSIYKVSKPTIGEMSISGSLTQIKLDNNNTNYSSDVPISIQYGPDFVISLSNCSTTERFDLGDYHRVVTDFVLLPNAVTSYLQF